MHKNLTKNSISCITVVHLKKLVYLQHLQTLFALNIICHWNVTSLIRGRGGQEQLALTNCSQFCPHSDDKITCTSFGSGIHSTWK